MNQPETAVDFLDRDVARCMWSWMRELLAVSEILGLSRTLALGRQEWLSMRGRLPQQLWLAAEQSWSDRRMIVLRATGRDPLTQFFDDDGEAVSVRLVMHEIRRALRSSGADDELVIER